MHRYKLQILIPHYHESDSLMARLLDSIAMQQAVNLDTVGVIICNDGSDVILSDEMLRRYPFNVQYFVEPHRGVSATRNFCLDRADSDYIMFCDADDMFGNALGFWLIYQEMDKRFDSLSSVFLEETVNAEGEFEYKLRERDGVFVHGKVFRTDYVKRNGIRFDERLFVDEDCLFVALCQNLTRRCVYVSTPFYIWKFRGDSVSHSETDFRLKAFLYMFESNDFLIEEFLRRNLKGKALIYAAQMVFNAYDTMHDSVWDDEQNDEIRKSILGNFYHWLDKNGYLWDEYPKESKCDMLMQLCELDEDDAYNYAGIVEEWVALQRHNKTYAR